MFTPSDTETDKNVLYRIMCGCVHNAQGQISAQISIRFCVNLLVSVSGSFSVSGSVSGSVNALLMSGF